MTRRSRSSSALSSASVGRTARYLEAKSFPMSFIPLMLVKREGAGNLPRTLLLNCQLFVDSCPLIQLLILVDGLGVLADVLFGSLEGIRDLLLGQPDRAILEMRIDLGFPVLGGVKNDVAHFPK